MGLLVRANALRQIPAARTGQFSHRRPYLGCAATSNFRAARPAPGGLIRGCPVFLSSWNFVYDLDVSDIPLLSERTMMIGTPDGSRASIPEITTRHAADYSHDISLRLLQNIEKTVDSLSEMEHALEWVARAAHAAERRGRSAGRNARGR